ncbi:hypothetical protein HDV00_011704 [Rhizophlyctis rosea]|nr:hypothetical protein HDV00_011704 [Rhizophlyctis rosea]
MKRGIVRPMMAQKLGSIENDYIDYSSNPWNGFNCIMNAGYIVFKKYYAFPAKGQTVKNTIKAMETFIGSGMKVTFLQCDNGASFQGEFPQWCKDHGITPQYTKPQSPWSNGVIESKGGAFKRALYQMLKTKSDGDWVSLTPEIVSNMNITMTFATGKSPNEIESGSGELHTEVGNRLQSVASKDTNKKVRVRQISKWETGFGGGLTMMPPT